MIASQHNSSRRRWIPGLVGLVFALQLSGGCATGDKKDSGEPARAGDSRGSGRDDDGDAANVSASRTTLVQSLGNNTFTGRTINRQAADEQTARLEPQKNSRDKRTLEGLLSAQRLAGRPISEVMGTARSLADIEMRRSVEREIGDDVKLEIAIGAVQQQKFALAEYFLSRLTTSREARVRAGAFNLVGVIAIRQERIPEAALAFREALKANSSYRAAQLNLGFLALRGGDFGLAKRMLTEMQDDWYVQSGLIVVERMENDNSRTDALCDRVLDRRAEHKPTLFNCGLHEYQGRRNFDKAKQLLTRMTKARGPAGSERWDERAFRLIGDIDTERAMQQDRKAAEGQPAAKPAGGAAAPSATPAPAPGR